MDGVKGEVGDGIGIFFFEVEHSSHCSGVWGFTFLFAHFFFFSELGVAVAWRNDGMALGRKVTPPSALRMAGFP